METSSYFSSFFQSKTRQEIYDDFDSVMKKIEASEVPAWDKM